jgi:serine/threonine-protein phosphatase 6 regulatory ankyrin repeat subunit B
MTLAKILFLGFLSGVAMATSCFADSYYSQYSYPIYSRRYSAPAPLISLNLDPQSRIDTSFRIAAREDRIADLNEFLKKGAQINSQSDQGATALIYAARNCSASVVAELLRQHANPNIIDRHGRTALMYALREGCAPTVKLLLNQPKITLSPRDHNGMTAYDYASASPELIEMIERRNKPSS